MIIIIVLFLVLFLFCSSVLFASLSNSTKPNSSFCPVIPIKNNFISLIPFIKNELPDYPFQPPIPPPMGSDKSGINIVDKLPEDKLFLDTSDIAIVMSGIASNGLFGTNWNEYFIPVYNKNGNHMLIKYNNKCHFLLLNTSDWFLYRSENPIDINTASWNISYITTTNYDDKFKFTDYSQLNI